MTRPLEAMQFFLLSFLHYGWHVLQIGSSFFFSCLLYSANVHHMAHWVLWRTEIYICVHTYRRNSIHYCTKGFCCTNTKQRVRWHSHLWWPSTTRWEWREKMNFICACHLEKKSRSVFVHWTIWEKERKRYRWCGWCLFIEMRISKKRKERGNSSKKTVVS